MLPRHSLTKHLQAAALLAIAIAGPVAAQSPALATGDWIQANRPRNQPPALSPEETRQVKQLTDGFEQPVKDKQPSEAWLIQLRPLAETGDKTAMRERCSGYNDLWKLEQARRVPISAMWSVEYWNLHDPDHEAGRRIRACISGTRRDGFWVGKTSRLGCGFDLKVKPDRFNYLGFEDYAEKKGPAPRNVVFIPRGLAVGASGDKARFDKLVSILEGGGAVDILDRTWAKEYADKSGPAEISLLQAAIDDHPSAVARLSAVNQIIAAEWRADQLKRWAAFDQKEFLTPNDLEQFELLSVVLGPEYLAKFGRTYLIYGETRIGAACSIECDICTAQRKLFEERKAEAEAEARARNALISDWAGPLFVAVRTDDQNGVYVGAQTTTRSQADTVGGRPQ